MDDPLDTAMNAFLARKSEREAALPTEQRQAIEAAEAAAEQQQQNFRRAVEGINLIRARAYRLQSLKSEGIEVIERGERDLIPTPDKPVVRSVSFGFFLSGSGSISDRDVLMFLWNPTGDVTATMSAMSADGSPELGTVPAAEANSAWIDSMFAAWLDRAQPWHY